MNSAIQDTFAQFEKEELKKKKSMMADNKTEGSQSKKNSSLFLNKENLSKLDELNQKSIRKRNEDDPIVDNSQFILETGDEFLIENTNDRI